MITLFSIFTAGLSFRNSLTLICWDQHRYKWVSFCVMIFNDNNYYCQKMHSLWCGFTSKCLRIIVLFIFLSIRCSIWTSFNSSPYTPIAEAASALLSFSEEMSDDEFLAFMKQEGLSDADCLKLKGKFYYNIYKNSCLKLKSELIQGFP